MGRNPEGGRSFRRRRRCSLLTDPWRVCSSLAPCLRQKSLAANVNVFMFLTTKPAAVILCPRHLRTVGGAMNLFPRMAVAADGRADPPSAVAEKTGSASKETRHTDEATVWRAHWARANIDSVCFIRARRQSAGMPRTPDASRYADPPSNWRSPWSARYARALRLPFVRRLQPWLQNVGTAPEPRPLFIAQALTAMKGLFKAIPRWKSLPDYPGHESGFREGTAPCATENRVIPAFLERVLSQSQSICTH